MDEEDSGLGASMPLSARAPDLDIHFQPIVSLKQKAVMGFEALARPHAIGVTKMFAEARQAGRLLELDRRCRAQAMEAFQNIPFPPRLQRPLLFLNFETSLMTWRCSSASLSVTGSWGF
jgi:EAL domain-containing protein (putative c-di-GMP-specific phosphodiesterase class I)